MQSEEAESASKQAHTGKSESIMDTAHQPDAPDAIPGLPNHVVEDQVLRSEYFPDPADFARLQTVSRAMRNAVAATGRPVEPMGWEKASKLGCLSALQRLQRQGNIPPFGKKEVFRWAAYRGDLETMKWAHENYFPMDVDTCNFTAAGGRLAVGARARLPVVLSSHLVSGGERAPRDGTVGVHGRNDAERGRA